MPLPVIRLFVWRNVCKRLRKGVMFNGLKGLCQLMQICEIWSARGWCLPNNTNFCWFVSTQTIFMGYGYTGLCFVSWHKLKFKVLERVHYQMKADNQNQGLDMHPMSHAIPVCKNRVDWRAFTLVPSSHGTTCRIVCEIYCKHITITKR